MNEQKEVAKWYVLHTYAGYENIVKANLEQMRENNNLQDIIVDINIPTRQMIEVKNNKRKVVEHKLFPCYVYVKLVYSPQMWYLLTNTRGVTGFVGPQGKAWPLTDEEVKRLRLETKVEDFKLKEGDSVKVVSGAFEGMIGTIKSINITQQKCDVNLLLFGSEKRITMEFIQIEALNK
jgi:transcriptional antiterminator NusG